MNRQQPSHEEQIERWVRQALARRAESVDAEAVVVAVRKRMAGAQPGPVAEVKRHGWVRAQYIAVRVAVAAAVLAAVVVTFQVRSEPASAETLIQQALEVATQNASDRCYRMEPVINGKADGDLLLHIPKEARLWTRGDRFVMDLSGSKAGDGKFVPRWGRDESGQVWFVPAPQVALRFEANDLQTAKGTGARLRMWSELFTLNSETLLKDVLANFDLEREPGLATTAGHRVEVINATVKPQRGGMPIQMARLELDADTKILRRAVIYRKLGSVTFTLTEVKSQPESYYQLATYRRPPTAETLLQQALQLVAEDHDDRCYTMEAELTAKADGDLFLQVPNQSRLWTRGDRFVMELPVAKDGKFVSRWGRDENGQVWFVPAQHVALRFDAKDLATGKGTAERLRLWSELYTLNAETLLNDVLVNYDVVQAPVLATTDGHQVEVITATVKPKLDSLAIQKAQLELDAETNVLRRVIVYRKTGSVTFTLAEIKGQPDSHYQLASYVSAEDLRRLSDIERGVKGILDFLKKDK